MKRKLSFALALAMLFLLVSPTALAYGYKKISVSEDNYIVTYTKDTVGWKRNKNDPKGRIYGFTDESLTQVTTNWIDCKNDECRIVAISSDGKAVKVNYPLDNGGRAKAWFQSSDFTYDSTLGGQNFSYPFVTLTKRVNIYRRADGKDYYGYAESSNQNDKVYIVMTKIQGSSSYTQLIYRTNNGKWKMGWAKSSDVLFY